MIKRLETGDGGINLITSEEGLRLDPYNDARGFATNGYGHLIRRGPVEPTDQPITKEEAIANLRGDLRTAENAVNSMVVPQLNQNQFDALVDFVYNVGAGNFERSSLLRYINSASLYLTSMIEHYFGEYDEGGGRVLPGLVTRRAREAKLFSTPV